MPPSLAGFLTPDLVQIKDLFVHEGILTSKAPHFASALNNSAYIEAKEKRFRFDDIDTDVIKAFAIWLYRDNLDDMCIKLKSAADLVKLAIGLYQFADRINLSHLQKLSLEMLSKAMNSGTALPQWRDVATHYENSMSGDEMRGKLVDYLAVVFVLDDFADVRARLAEGVLNEELVVDLLHRMNEISSIPARDTSVQKIRDWYRVRQRNRALASASAPAPASGNDKEMMSWPSLY